MLQSLSTALQQLKPALREGMSEYTLIQKLQQPPYCVFAADALNDTLTMYRCHFILFHMLYKMQQQLARSKEGWLAISALEIKLHSPEAIAHGENAVTTPDSVRAYYLELNNLKQTGRDEVAQLLEGFWQKMAGHMACSAEQVAKAYALLQLPPQASAKDAKIHYRRQMHLNHPDKGGRHQHAQQIKWAYSVVKQHLEG